MTVVLNDPSGWPFISWGIVFSHWTGSSSIWWCLDLTLHLAVAAAAVVVYDWGEWDVVLQLLSFL
jgi:hypothetical protein